MQTTIAFEVISVLLNLTESRILVSEIVIVAFYIALIGIFWLVLHISFITSVNYPSKHLKVESALEEMKNVIYQRLSDIDQGN